MHTQNITDNAVTVIIGQRVITGIEQQFLAWQHDVNESASHYPGFVGAEVAAPTEAQPDWVVVYRFDSLANLGAWMNSATRLERMAVGEQYFDGPATQQIVGGAAKPADQLVTVVVTHHVRPEDIDAFSASTACSATWRLVAVGRTSRTGRMKSGIPPFVSAMVITSPFR